MSFVNIDKTLRKVVDDLALGVDVVVGNDDFDPLTSTGDTWIELTQLPTETIPGDKSPTAITGGFDENRGIFQISIFDKDVGGGEAAIMALAETVRASAGFTPTTIHTDFTDEVQILSVSRNQARVQGPFYQVDISVAWLSFVDR